MTRKGSFRLWRRLLPVVATVVSLWALNMPVLASTPGEDALASADQVVTWSGASGGGPPLAPVVYTPETCEVAAEAELCDVFYLDVDLPPSTFTEPSDVLFVAIRWPSNFMQWNLYAYRPDGSLAVADFRVDSNAQVAYVYSPTNGRYAIVAAAASAEPTTYTGEARVLLDQRARMDPRTVLAPQLWTVPPNDFHVACSEPDPSSTPTNDGCTDVPPAPANPTGWRWGGGFTNSCYADETTTASGAVPKCLRFSNNIRNAGLGPLVLRARMVDGVAGGACRMDQIVVRADGKESARDAGPCEFHAAHGHFHYLNTAQFSMIEAPEDPTTPPDLSQAPVASGRKLGYCLVDIDLWADVTDTARLSMRRWSFPTCNAPDPTQTHLSEAPVQEMGVSPGWGDVYTWDLPGQYLDITDVPDGTYDVVSFANPDCSLLEARSGMEGSATRIRLQGGTATVLAEFGPFGVQGCTVPTSL